MIILPTNKLQKVLLSGGCEQRNLPSEFTAGPDVVPTPDAPMDSVFNNGVLKARHQCGLPFGYQAVEYLESTGTQWINTQTVARTVEYIKAKIMCTDNTSTSSWQTFIGSSASNNDQRNIFAFVKTYQKLGYRWHMTGNPTQSDIPFILNTKYTLEVDGNTIWFGGNRIEVSGSNENSDRSLYLFCQGANSNVFRGRFYYAQLGSDKDTLVCNLIPARRISDNELGMYDTVTGTFLTNAGTGTFIAGNTVSDPIEIYTDGTVETINVQGQNLFDKDSATVLNLTGAATTPLAYRADRFGVYIPVEPSTTYTISRTDTIYLNLFETAFVPAVGVATTQYTAMGTASTQTITTAATTRYLYIFGGAISFISSLQIEKGSTATTYEPYFNGGTATAEMLLKVGDYQDVQSILDGVVTRKVGVKVLDGTEDWTYSSSRFRLEISDYLVGSSIMATIISHYKLPAINTGSIANGEARFGKLSSGDTVSNNNIFVIHDDNCTDLNSYKAWLADQYANGTPVIIVYPLDEPTTESVAGQTLQVQAGDNTLEITQASLNNLELEAEYQAAVSLTIQEVQDANLDPNVEVTIN
jgi:hypothetical protein